MDLKEFILKNNDIHIFYIRMLKKIYDEPTYDTFDMVFDEIEDFLWDYKDRMKNLSKEYELKKK